METFEFSVPHEYYVSSEQVNRVINVIQDSVLKLEFPKTNEHYTDVIKVRVSEDDFGDTLSNDLLACHFIITTLMKSHEFRDKYYIWVETTDSDKYSKFKQNLNTTTLVGEADTLGRIRFGQVLSICVRLKSTMLERIKYNTEMGKTQYENIE